MKYKPEEALAFIKTEWNGQTEAVLRLVSGSSNWFTIQGIKKQLEEKSNRIFYIKEYSPYNPSEDGKSAEYQVAVRSLDIDWS